MATARFETIICFSKHKALVRIECAGCGHVLTLKPKQVAEGFGWMTSLGEVERRLVCSLCGKKSAKLKPAPDRR